MKQLLNQVPDISEPFQSMSNEYFLPGKVIEQQNDGSGKVEWVKHRKKIEWAFNKIGTKLEVEGGKEIPQEDYEINPILPFRISQVSRRAIRLQMSLENTTLDEDADSLMLDNSFMERSKKQDAIPDSEKGITAEVSSSDQWEIILKNDRNETLTKSVSMADQKSLHTKNTPTCFIRKSEDYSKSFAFSFSLDVDEKIYGCGESFTSMNKRGQILHLSVTDAQSAGTREMYKPIPFFISSKGYGMFVHSSAPMTFDFGCEYDSVGSLYVADEQMDLFFFSGTIPQIITEYTSITGRSKVPPVWSFGLWFGKFSYKTQEEVLDSASLIKDYKIPCDVFHLDAGWFEYGMNCDYQFGSAFPDPDEMIHHLRKNNFWLSLWQIPYYTRRNPLFEEVYDQKLYVKNGKGSVPTSDVILDFSNEDAVKWYQSKISPLLKLGASAIKADFGEAAPTFGQYSSGKSGLYEHNLYPLRYGHALYQILENSQNADHLIWARSAWAGSQRYPVHWAGDPEVTSQSMASTLRAGLSLGLTGFTFWSHDIGGFSSAPNPELYLRWAFMGIFSSHSRVHGFPPREPWLFGEDFLDSFRKIINVRYQLMPYIYSQAQKCCDRGHPMVRPMFFHHPEDSTCWMIEDQYFFGEDLLIAPLLKTGQKRRKVYLPEGGWFDYFTHARYEGGWLEIDANEIPGICLVRDGAIIPQVKLAQNTNEIDWNEIFMYPFSNSSLACQEFSFPKGSVKIHLTAQGEIKILESPAGTKIKRMDIKTQ